MEKINIQQRGKKYSKSEFPAIFGDFDKDGILNIDDKHPFNKKLRGKINDQISMADTFSSVIDIRNLLDNSMEEVVSDLEKVSPPDAKLYARTKTPYSIFKKLVDKRLLDDKKGLKDLVGTTVAVDDYDDLIVVRDQIRSGSMGNVIEEEDYYTNPKFGYRAYHYIISYNGIPVEIQLKTKQQKAVNEISHEAYKQGNLNGEYLEYLTDLANKGDQGDLKAKADLEELLSSPDIRKKLQKFKAGGSVTDKDQAFYDLVDEIISDDYVSEQTAIREAYERLGYKPKYARDIFKSGGKINATRKKMVLEGKIRFIRENSVPIMSKGQSIKDLTVNETGMKDVPLEYYKKSILEAYDIATDKHRRRYGNDYQGGGEIIANPSYKFQSIVKRWLDDNPSDGLKYKLAVALLKGEKDADEKLGIKEGQYERLLRSLEKLGGESPHEMAWRTNNYSTHEAEVWTKEALAKFFALKGGSTYQGGGEIKDIKEEHNVLLLPKFVYLNGKKYIGKAGFISGYNGYDSTIDDGVLSAIIDNSSFNKNGSPNYLTDKKGMILRAKSRRGMMVNFGKEDRGLLYAEGGEIKELADKGVVWDNVVEFAFRKLEKKISGFEEPTIAQTNRVFSSVAKEMSKANPFTNPKGISITTDNLKTAYFDDIKQTLIRQNKYDVNKVGNYWRYFAVNSDELKEYIGGSTYAEGGAITLKTFKYDPTIDYMSEYDKLPTEIQTIINSEKYSDIDELDNHYEELLSEIENLGWTFEYDMSGGYHSLRPIGEPEPEFKEGGEITLENFEYDPNVDYMSVYQKLPKEIRTLINSEKYSDIDELDNHYEELLSEIENLGWTFEYDMSGGYHSLRPIGEPEPEFKDGGSVKPFKKISISPKYASPLDIERLKMYLENNSLSNRTVKNPNSEVFMIVVDTRTIPDSKIEALNEYLSDNSWYNTNVAGNSLYKKGGRIAKHNQSLDMKYLSNEKHEQAYAKNRKRPYKKMKSGGDVVFIEEEHENGTQEYTFEQGINRLKSLVKAEIKADPKAVNVKWKKSMLLKDGQDDLIEYGWNHYGFDYYKKGGRIAKHNQSLDMKYLSNEKHEQAYAKNRKRPYKTMKSGGNTDYSPLSAGDRLTYSFKNIGLKVIDWQMPDSSVGINEGYVVYEDSKGTVREITWTDAWYYVTMDKLTKSKILKDSTIVDPDTLKRGGKVKHNQSLDMKYLSNEKHEQAYAKNRKRPYKTMKSGGSIPSEIKAFIPRSNFKSVKEAVYMKSFSQRGEHFVNFKGCMLNDQWVLGQADFKTKQLALKFVKLVNNQ